MIRTRWSNKGLTLIELLVVVLIVAALAAIAIPGYRGYMQRARRTEAKTALEQVRAAQEMWRAEKGAYRTGADTITALQTSMGGPGASPGGEYDLAFTALAANAFTAQAQPKAGGRQVGDGSLFIDHLGDKWDSNNYHYPDSRSKWSK